MYTHKIGLDQLVNDEFTQNDSIICDIINKIIILSKKLQVQIQYMPSF